MDIARITISAGEHKTRTNVETNIRLGATKLMGEITVQCVLDLRDDPKLSEIYLRVIEHVRSSLDRPPAS